MEAKTAFADIELICAIVNYGMGSKMLKLAKKYGVLGGTITLAKGTADTGLWNYLGLSDIRKEVLYMVADRETAYEAMDKIYVQCHLDKPNHGIAYTTSVCATVGTRRCKCDHLKDERGEEKTMYQVITVIVDKGNAEDVVEAAVRGGSKGQTIINARGSGIHETRRLFSMDIEPEKEIVLILAETERAEAIISAIQKDMNIDEPGKGIIYVQNVNKTYGVFK